MKKASILNQLEYNQNKPAISVLLETDSTKEIRILMKAEQTMKEHKTPFPIVVEVFEGEVEFSVEGNMNMIKRGDILALEGNVPHDLKAISDSIIRLTLSKSDSVARVEKVTEK